MPRLLITTPDGTAVARGVYPVADARLLHVGSMQNFVPAGAFLRTPSVVIPPRWILPDGLWLCHAEEIGGWPRAETFVGCCGPDGSTANVLHPHLDEPAAYESADCHTDRAIRLVPGAWREEVEEDGEGEAWVGWIKLANRAPQAIAAAIGRDETEARHRLERACADYMEFHWRRRPPSWRRQHLMLHASPASEWLLRVETV